jgi:hypothetical protein
MDFDSVGSVWMVQDRKTTIRKPICLSAHANPLTSWHTLKRFQILNLSADRFFQMRAKQKKHILRPRNALSFLSPIISLFSLSLSLSLSLSFYNFILSLNGVFLETSVVVVVVREEGEEEEKERLSPCKSHL